MLLDPSDSTKQDWQAKYWTSQAGVEKSQLDTSVIAALSDHPDLTKYTIAISADPTGRTGGHGNRCWRRSTTPAAGSTAGKRWRMAAD